MRRELPGAQKDNTNNPNANRTRLPFFVLLALGFAGLLVVFQNCSPLQVSFKSLGAETSLTSLISAENNGVGYGGKPDGVYYRFVPDFSCETQEAPTAVLTIASETDVHYRENSQFKCGLVDGPLPIERVTRSRMQNEVVSYQAIPFERKNSAPTAIPANLLEAWCRDLSPGALFEVVSHFDRTSQQAVARMYSGLDQGAGSVLVNVTPDAPVTRLVTPTRVHLRGNDFDLLIDRNRLSPAAGEFLADFQRAGKTTTLSCALGGALDPNVWPIRKLSDAPLPQRSVLTETFSISPDRSTIAFRGSLDPRTPETKVVPILGSIFFWKNGLLRAFPTLKTSAATLDQSLDSVLHFSTDSRNALFLARESALSPQYIYRLSIDRGEPERISSDITNVQSIYLDSLQTRMAASSRISINSESRIWTSAEPFSAPSITPQTIASLGVNFIQTYPHSTLNKLLLVFHEPKDLMDPRFSYPRRYEMMNWDGTDRQDITPERPGAEWFLHDSFFHHQDGDSEVFLRVFYKQGLDSCSLSTRGVHLRSLRQMDFGLNVMPLAGYGEWLTLITTPQLPGSCLTLAANPYSLPWTPRLLNTTTGAQMELPGYLHRSLIQNQTKTALLGFEKTSASARTRWMRVDLATLTSTELCHEHEGEWMGETGSDSIAALQSGGAIALSHAAGRVLIYSAAPDGRCTKLNGFPAENVPGGYIEIDLAPDDSALVVRIQLTQAGPQQLVYVPLNSAPPIQITSPRYVNIVSSLLAFVGADSKRILLIAPDGGPEGFRYLYLWEAPRE
ncbi:MAG: hypothetical protein NDI61_02660 [Bdellovibrionaceae bacterium]|nr:hypothetical protein [Pseudobdellovibrionaceae bacterium]